MNINSSCPNPVFYSVLTAAAKTPVESLLEEAATFKKEGEEKARALQDVSDRARFLCEVQRLYQTISNTINLLSAQGVPFAEIKNRVSTSLNLCRAELAASWNQFKERQASFNGASSCFAMAADAASSSSNDFVPPRVALQKKPAGCPVGAVLSTEKHRFVELNAKEPSHSHDSHDDVQEKAEEAAKGKMIRHLEHRFGKSKSLVAEFILNFCLGPDCEHSQSPWRDQAIGVAAHIGIAEVLHCFLPHMLPAYATIIGSHLVATGASALEPTVNHFAQDPDVVYWFNRQYELCGEGLPIASVQGLLQLAQIPSQLLLSLHHEIATRVAACTDRFGLTDENIARAAVSSMKFIADISPELLEERAWARAREDIQRRNNP